MKIRKGMWSITLICILLGFFCVKAFEDPDSREEFIGIPSLEKIDELLQEKKLLEQQYQQLIDRYNSYLRTVEEHEKKIADRSVSGQRLLQQLQEARMLAGMTELEGPGVEVVLNDRKRDTIIMDNPHFLSAYIVHDSDLLAVVNELRAAGAEAIAINGERILATSRISCGGPTINVGRYERFAPPFVIHAIGDPEKLAGYFKNPDSIYHTLVFWGLQFDITKKELVRIPRYFRDVTMQYAIPIKEGE